jgi:hypothetical protein
MPAIRFLSIKNHLDIHSWMVLSEVHLNWSYPSGGRNRIKICFSCMAQVRNLPTRGCFFPSEYTLKIHSWMVSSEPHLNFVLAKMTPATGIQICLMDCTHAGSKPAGDNVSFLSDYGGLKDLFMDGFLGGPS